MKIALVAPSYLPSRRANTFQVMKMAQALALIGHDVRLAVPDDPAQSGYTQEGEARSWERLANHYGLQLEFPIEWLQTSSNMRRYDFAWRSVRWAQRWQADVLYTRLPQAALLASKSGLATILEIHDLPRGKIGPLNYRSFLGGRGTRRLVVISQALANDLSRRFGAPKTTSVMVVLPDGVDLARYREVPPPEMARIALLAEGAIGYTEEHSKRFTAGYTGHLYPGRGIHLVLTLAEGLPDVVFLIVGGETAQIEAVRREAETKGLKNVVITGFVPNASLPLYQAACDVLLMPYQRRVAASSGGDIAPYLSPMKLFEYMACGRVILSSDLPVLREILSKDNAVLLPPADPDAWVDAIQILRNDHQRWIALANQARNDVQKHTWEARAARMMAGLEDAGVNTI